MTELLSPGGDLEKIKTAFYFGADAVYCGGPCLQLRAESAGLTVEELREAATYAHGINKKLYVTVNAFARSHDFIELKSYLRLLEEIGANAVIVSDIGVLEAAAEFVPYLPVHVSTQASCLNYRSANVYHKLGAKRIILGRELSLNEIRVIRDNTPPELELEAFVHGAMCMAYSGRCLISAYLTGRDANRGDCAQSCRWRYHLVEQKRPNEYYPICEDGQGTTILSSRDLNTLSIIQAIRNAGVSSFKIEGRMKSVYYVAAVTNAYRHALDMSAPLEVLESEVRTVSHREYSTGFYEGGIKDTTPAGAENMQDCIFIAVVRGFSNGIAEIELRNRFAVGDRLEILSPAGFGNQFTVTCITDEAGNELIAANIVQQKLFLACPLPLKPGDILRKRLQHGET